MTVSEQQQSIDVLSRCLNLQAEDEQDVTKQQRLDELMADFETCDNPPMQYVSGWLFCVPASFRAALDIKLTPRMIDGKQIMKWTQGSWFHFEGGDTIYDSIKAYRPWNLNNIQFCLDIRKASPATPAGKNRARQPGTVIFDLLKPDAERKQLRSHQQIVLSQDEFVRLLIDGTGLPDGE